ncbi:MAG: riboflavin synthase [Eubacterium sp.]|nr:riboflavin synthase [Eubacterium sp.]
MFTGIIEEVGTIDRISRGSRSAKLRVSCRVVTEGTKVGDSIAVNGVCLTATSVASGVFEADVMEETVARSSLATLKNGSRVNLERAMPADGRFGGHIVAGHVDGTGTIRSIRKEEMAVVFEIEVADAGGTAGAQAGAFAQAQGAGSPAALMRYIVEKGSIAIDGISLTVASVAGNRFTVSIIPHSIANTTLADRKTGDIVNLETDIIGKYVEKLLYGNNSTTNTTSASENPPNHVGGALSGDFNDAMTFLLENGY